MEAQTGNEEEKVSSGAPVQPVFSRSLLERSLDCRLYYVSQASRRGRSDSPQVEPEQEHAKRVLAAASEGDAAALRSLLLLPDTTESSLAFAEAVRSRALAFSFGQRDTELGRLNA